MMNGSFAAASIVDRIIRHEEVSISQILGLDGEGYSSLLMMCGISDDVGDAPGEPDESVSREN